eukprot:m.127948 g.127948  ORF g.127948 m.127948 type:complete len:369 (+) comp29307_c0_seq1:71-1177(+)
MQLKQSTKIMARFAMLSLVGVLGVLKTCMGQEHPFPSSCDSFQIWHIKSQMCVMPPSANSGQRLVLSRTCGDEALWQRAPKDPTVTFTWKSAANAALCVHPLGGAAFRDDVEMVLVADNCADNQVRLSTMWQPVNNNLGSFQIKHGQYRQRCMYPMDASTTAGAKMVWHSAACGDDAGNYLASCDGHNPWTRSTTTVTATTTTLTDTMTATTATDTVIRMLGDQLGGVEKLLEDQILKYDKHVQDLSDKIDGLQDQLHSADKERVAGEQQILTLASVLEKQQNLMSDLRSVLVGVGETDSDLSAAPSDCVTEQDDGGKPFISAQGTTLAVNSCGGDIVLRSKSCSVNPCRLEGQVQKLLQRMQALEDL